VASADAGGCVKVWDLRTGAERLSTATGSASAAGVAYDASGQARAAALAWAPTLRPCEHRIGLPMSGDGALRAHALLGMRSSPHTRTSLVGHDPCAPAPPDHIF
jgi:hypothetical protein